ncbi:VIR protein [Plasmodium vivax]|uniref:VIR protein n=1 Tax=Plasmodium vivax TaxID=5855 RepID=A0A1G4HLF1_PLAVI|nr:VIR protein [Plasmodium vivax]
MLLCIEIESSSKLKEDAINICKKFVLYFKELSSSCSTVEGPSTTPEFANFLNYWLHNQLKEKSINDNLKTTFYEKLEEKYNTFQGQHILKGAIQNKEDTNFSKFDILYQLYKKLSDVTITEDEKCLNFFQSCKEHYNKGLEECFEKVDTNFCNALNKFNSIYEEKKTSFPETCNGNKLPTFPEIKPFNSSSDTTEETSNIFFDLIGSTQKNGEHGLPKMSKNLFPNLHQVLSFHYTMPFEYEEDKIKCKMMDIMLEFFKYYNLNRGNTSVHLFVNEFFKHFYENKKTKYDKIYTECSNKTQIDSYCSLYKACNDQIRRDLLSIKDSVNINLENIAKAYQDAISGYLYYQVTSHENEQLPFLAHSKSLNIGIGLICVIFFYSLYKYTPIGFKLRTLFTKPKKNEYDDREVHMEHPSDSNSNFKNGRPRSRHIHIGYRSISDFFS